ncbi:RnfABCDGE type electron transport complex subunit D [Spirochaeta africana]|uniref:Putative NADH:ubiquinone oxidoreductase, subunit RnfD n=1 Tax=Spirochaeta africana (strain ATCC 700263 / DSM 8902 / Z-7692) TaxID=889378 RepID=H9UK19_SPIAZ|nr:RnfABCDGE type electron transport complex subunit D [Spirochaeta africana]AFG37862.1 putative NADH:ubiquinone oxidoreductase, subunit RnfD [Spirochaeta africana DSM 8902]
MAKTGLFQKQDVMRRVVYSLIPIFIFSILMYGWRVLTITTVVFVFGILSEYIMERGRKKKVSEAVLVTCALFALSLPPMVPLWIAAVGIVFAVIIGKEVFGGFGRNIFNPAITGRLFVYISFPLALQQTWMAPGWFGTGGAYMVDGVSGPTPLQHVYGGAYAALEGLRGWVAPSAIAAGEAPGLLNLLTGIRPGSLGEGPVILIVLAAVYLIVTKTANWKLIVATFAGATVTAAGFFLGGLIPGLSPASTSFLDFLLYVAMYLMSGSILFVTVFMATDPISGPNKPGAQWVYGFMIGAVSMTVRTFSGFPEGTSFGVMFANTFSPLLDEWFPKPKKKAKKKAAPAKAKPAAAQGAAT